MENNLTKGIGGRRGKNPPCTGDRHEPRAGVSTYDSIALTPMQRYTEGLGRNDLLGTVMVVEYVQQLLWAGGVLLEMWRLVARSE